MCSLCLLYNSEAFTFGFGFDCGGWGRIWSITVVWEEGCEFVEELLHKEMSHIVSKVTAAFRNFFLLSHCAF